MAQYCVTRGCKRITDSWRCPDCTAAFEAARAGRRDAGRTHASRRATEPGRAWYQSAAWRALRLVILHEAHYQCQIGHGAPWCARTATTVDHIEPHAGRWAGFWDRANLAAVCKPCHDRKTAREIAGRRTTDHRRRRAG